MRVALDTNVLVYLSGVEKVAGDAAKIATAREMLAQIQTRATIIIGMQALGELFSVLRKSSRGDAGARTFVLNLANSYRTAESSRTTFASALDLAVNHRLQFWDCLILSASAEAGCDLILSEDMQDGFVLRGMTIVNPFAAPLHPKLAVLLAG